jgi:hypothetical protein
MKLAGMMIAALLLTGCTVKHSGEKGNEKVDIDTPMGSLKVNTDKAADPKATGLASYPGAVETKDEDGDKSANVNMNFGGFGLKVAAAHFHTDDAPSKVMDFYKKDLDRYGNVLVCDSKARSSAKEADKDSDVLTCGDSNNKHGIHIDEYHSDSDATELKVGTQHRQHVVAIRPKGNGTDFALVYVELKGGKKESM